jgi:hypothetical protein
MNSVGSYLLFLQVSCWVSSMIVTTEDVKARAAVLARLIEIADVFATLSFLTQN